MKDKIPGRPEISIKVSLTDFKTELGKGSFVLKMTS